MPLPPPSKYAELHMEVYADARPATALERWFASEMTYAAWEMERVRVNAANTAAESRLQAAYNRASRNWNRARKELTQLQTNRARQVTRLTPGRQKVAAAAPLANPVPPARAGVMLDHLLDGIQNGEIPTNATSIVGTQEAR